MSKDMKDSLKEVGAKVGETIDNMKDKAQDTMDQAKDKGQDIADQAKDKAQDAMDQAKDKGQDLKDKANKHFNNADDVKDQAKQHFEDFAGVAQDEFSRMYGSDSKMETLMNFVRDRPVVALISAMILGTIFSKLLRCCKRRKC